MKRFVLIVCVLAIAFIGQGQSSTPKIQWQKCIGGSGDETISTGYSRTQIQLLARDKNHLFIGGSPTSQDGDVAFAADDPGDLWIAKLDLSGNIIWKTSLDGKGVEYLNSISETSDGSLLIFGTSLDWPNTAPDDAMLIKLAPNGTVVWQKYYGGTGEDHGGKLFQTSDGNYTFIGYSRSDDGDLAGKPASHELWVGKMNTEGTLLWSKKYPKASDTQGEYGFLIEEDGAGNLYIGANMDSTFMVGKLTGTGDMLWQKVMQGSGMDWIYALKVTGPDKITLAGTAYENSIDFPGPNLGSFDTDGFLMTLDGEGKRTFFKRFGGSGYDEIWDFVQLPDQSFLTLGVTVSNDGYLAGDSVPGDFDQTWVANIAPDGQVRWAKKFGGTGNDWGSNIAALSNNSYVFFGETTSNDYDVSGNHGGRDFWLVRLGNTSNLKGTVYYDDNSNNAKDASEPWAHNALVNISKPGYDRSTTTGKGYVNIDLDTGAYIISALVPNYTATPVNKTFTDYFQTDSISLPLKPVAGRQDLQVDLIPIGPARPGFGLTYKILYRNVGTTTVDNAVITFDKDSRLTVNGVEPTATAGMGSALTWALGSLAPRDSGSIILTLTVAAPPATNNGDTLRSTAAINPVEGDVATQNNTSRLNQIVQGSYDPNDKQEASGGVITPAQVASGNYLSYQIRFQNTGNDTAFDISVRDTLDAKLDWSTLEMVAASHPYQLTIEDDNKLHWQFNNILLPDSNRNEPASHGYIAYKIKAKSTAAVGDQIRNDASIYFDYNLPVVTNEFVTRVMNTTPDLVMTSNLTPTTATVGTIVSASFSVTNAGSADAGANSVHFYLSPDATLTPNSNGDALLLSYPLPALASGAGTGPVTRLIPIPCTQPAGTYYVFLVADGGSVVAESNEDNNTTSNALVVQALEVTVTPATPSICAGSSVTLTANGASTYSWSPAEGLSTTTGASVTASPAASTTYTVTGTANGCTQTRDVTVTITPAVTPSVNISYTGCPSTTLTFTATPVNGGNNPEVEWYIDNILMYTGNPFTLNNAHNGMQVYATLASNAPCASPLTATSSMVTIDCLPAPVADLSITSSVAPASVPVGSMVNASFTVTNTGNTDAGASKVLFYQSADAVLTPGLNGDVSLFAYPVGALAAGASTGPVTRALPIPCTQPAGTYYIFLVADGEQVIAESNENNNTASNALTVQSLEVTVTPASTSVCAGASASLTASGATTYTWSPAVGLSATAGATVTSTPSATTTYTVSGSANGCTATKTVTVTVTPAVTPTISVNYTGCPGTTLSFTATTTNGGTAPQVEWFVNNAASGTGSSFTLNNAANGVQVYARLTSNAGCAAPQTATSPTVTVNCITTSVPSIDGLEEIKVLPNPTHGVLAVRLKLNTAKAVSFRISDAHGREVYRSVPERLNGTATRTIDLSQEAAGAYYLQVQVGSETLTEKIVRVN